MNPELNQMTTVKHHHSFLNEALIIIGVVLVISCGILLYQNQQLKQELNASKSSPSNQINSLPSPAPMDQLSDQMINWKTYAIDQAISFQYPDILEANEPDKGLINLSPVKRISDIDVYFSIDARLQNNYVDFDKAVVSTKQNMVNPVVTKISNGVKISGTIGPGFGEGQPMTIVLLKYKKGAITFETSLNIANRDPKNITLFDQILSTFRFVEKLAGNVCGGWNTGGEIVCSCEGTLTKSICPKDTICDSGDYFCSGQCGSCCFNGIADNPSYPRCPAVKN